MFRGNYFHIDASNHEELDNYICQQLGINMQEFVDTFPNPLERMRMRSKAKEEIRKYRNDISKSTAY